MTVEATGPGPTGRGSERPSSSPTDGMDRIMLVSSHTNGTQKPTSVADARMLFRPAIDRHPGGEPDVMDDSGGQEHAPNPRAQIRYGGMGSVGSIRHDPWRRPGPRDWGGAPRGGSRLRSSLGSRVIGVSSPRSALRTTPAVPARPDAMAGSPGPSGRTHLARWRPACRLPRPISTIRSRVEASAFLAC